MNPSESESYLYPASYYEDMAFFVTKSISYIFTFPDREILRMEEPCSLMKSDTPVIAAAIDGQFASHWELHLYRIILRVFQRSSLDESVVVGMVVLLDLLGDVYRMGTYMAGDECELRLAPYPDTDYISYAMAAFMLSYRLLSEDSPVEERFWEGVMEGIVAPDMVRAMEDEFRMFLTKNSKLYPPSPILPQDPAYQFHYAGDRPVPPNPLICRRKYLRTKWAMYTHIRMAMTSRGENNLQVDPSTTFVHKDLLLLFPPCYEYMMKRDTLFREARLRVPELWGASQRDVHEYLEAERRRDEEKRVYKAKMRAMSGLGFMIKEDGGICAKSYSN